MHNYMNKLSADFIKKWIFTKLSSSTIWIFEIFRKSFSFAFNKFFCCLIFNLWFWVRTSQYSAQQVQLRRWKDHTDTIMNGNKCWTYQRNCYSCKSNTIGSRPLSREIINYMKFVRKKSLKTVISCGDKNSSKQKVFSRRVNKNNKH